MNPLTGESPGIRFFHCGGKALPKGTTNGTVTDFDGNFRLKVEPGKTLVISYIGFETVEMAAADGMTVTMKDNAEVLAEVVVKHKLESKLPGEISITSDMQKTPPLWQKVKRT